MEIFSIKNLNFAYPKSKFKVLQDINLHIEEGSFNLIYGASGCGKSTLLRHLKNEFCPIGARSGQVLYCGEPLLTYDKKVMTSEIGFVLQDVESQIVCDKVYSELAFSLENLGYERDIIKKRVYEVASYFGLQNYFYSDISSLSGGQKQLLNLASAVVSNPKVLILDEPTSQLDPIAAREFLDFLVRLNKDFGTTVVVSEHRIHDIFPLCDRVVLIDDGKVLCDKKPIDALAWAAANENECVLVDELPSFIGAFKGLKVDANSIMTINDAILTLKNYAKSNHSFNEKLLENNLKTDKYDDKSSALEQTAHTNKSDKIVELKDVSFRYGKNENDILSHSNLSIEKGSVLCLVGSNGAGKTTLLKIIGGVLSPYQGKVLIDKKNIKSYKNNSLYNGLISYLPQNPKHLFLCDTVLEELQIISKDAEKINELVDELDIKDVLGSHPFDLSFGQSQRVAIAKVLLTNPQIIMFDEPTKGLDLALKVKLGEMILKLKHRGVTIIIATHDIEFAGKIATKCTMIFGGDIVGSVSRANFFNDNMFYITCANKIARSIGLDCVTNEELILKLNDIGGENN